MVGRAYHPDPNATMQHHRPTSHHESASMHTYKAKEIKKEKIKYHKEHILLMILIGKPQCWLTIESALHFLIHNSWVQARGPGKLYCPNTLSRLVASTQQGLDTCTSFLSQKPNCKSYELGYRNCIFCLVV